MTFTKHVFKFLSSKYNIILTSLLVVVFIVLRFIIRVELSQDNVTWIYSSSMQTLAAIIALLPISYGYYINNLDNEKNENLDSYIVERLKGDVYFDMMTVIVYSLLVIILNLVSFFFDASIRFTFIVALLTVEGIGLISTYIYRLFDPNKVKEILKEYDTSSSKVSDHRFVSLDTFITKYLVLETSVKDFISNENDSELVDKLPLYDIVDNLSKDFPEINEHFTTFKEIIFHRNNVIHNYTDTQVDYTKYSKIIELTELFDRYNNLFIQKKIFPNVVSIRNTIEKCVKEYLIDMQNEQSEIGNVPDDFKEDVVSLLHSYFISDYYFTKSLDDALDTDFEVIQNNFSEKKLIGMDVKSIQQKNIIPIAKSYFKRLENRFMHLFLINFNPIEKTFTIIYQTRDKELRQSMIS